MAPAVLCGSGGENVLSPSEHAVTAVRFQEVERFHQRVDVIIWRGAGEHASHAEAGLVRVASWARVWCGKDEGVVERVRHVFGMVPLSREGVAAGEGDDDDDGDNEGSRFHGHLPIDFLAQRLKDNNSHKDYHISCCSGKANVSDSGADSPTRGNISQEERRLVTAERAEIAENECLEASLRTLRPLR